MYYWAAALSTFQYWLNMTLAPISSIPEDGLPLAKRWKHLFWLRTSPPEGCFPPQNEIAYLVYWELNLKRIGKSNGGQDSSHQWPHCPLIHFEHGLLKMGWKQLSDPLHTDALHVILTELDFRLIVLLVMQVHNGGPPLFLAPSTNPSTMRPGAPLLPGSSLLGNRGVLPSLMLGSRGVADEHEVSVGVLEEVEIQGAALQGVGAQGLADDASALAFSQQQQEKASWPAAEAVRRLKEGRPLAAVAAAVAHSQRISTLQGADEAPDDKQTSWQRPRQGTGRQQKAGVLGSITVEEDMSEAADDFVAMEAAYPAKAVAQEAVGGSGEHTAPARPGAAPGAPAALQDGGPSAAAAGAVQEIAPSAGASAPQQQHAAPSSSAPAQDGVRLSAAEGASLYDAAPSAAASLQHSAPTAGAAAPGGPPIVGAVAGAAEGGPSGQWYTPAQWFETTSTVGMYHAIFSHVRTADHRLRQGGPAALGLSAQQGEELKELCLQVLNVAASGHVNLPYILKIGQAWQVIRPLVEADNWAAVLDAVRMEGSGG